jgi:5'-3' exonuclease
MGPFPPRDPAGQPDTAPPAAPSQEPAQARGGTPEPTVLLLDATGLLVRCSRAARRTGLHAGGVSTGTLMMFIGALSRKIRTERPDYLVLAWDGQDPLHWRRRLYPAYKANRHAPSWMGTEMAQALEFTEAARMRTVFVPCFEADDIIATLCRLTRYGMPDARLVLCSDDLDMLQLLDERTVLTGLTTDSLITAGEILHSWGIEPARLSWVRALCGDKSDNIPGLPGVGPRKAVQMIRRGGGRWPLPPGIVPPDQYETVLAWQRIIDLTFPLKSPEGCEGMDYSQIMGQARWRPPGNDEVLRVLGKYQLSGLADRVREGRFWLNPE